MRYLMLVCVDPDLQNKDVEGVPDIEEWVEENDAKGIRLIGDRVRPENDATTVRVRDGQVLLTDGPYVETKEHLGGFAVVDVADEDEARLWAGRIAVACGWPQEVRPFQVRMELPESPRPGS